MRSTDTAAGCSANASAPRKIPEGQPLEIRILRTDVIPGVPSRDVLSGNCHVVDHVDFGQVNSCPGVEKVQEADCGMGFAACLIQKKPRVSPFWRPLSRPTVASRKAIGAVPAVRLWALGAGEPAQGGPLGILVLASLPRIPNSGSWLAAVAV
mmetsp:Transcript_1037/g.2407  ORF Transcript_1037/g.2407 Transcript_1037/m.2407 type:complete len:153 (-) Transcript_1037:330-788(-)